MLVEVVTAGQAAGVAPANAPVRLASLLLALAHGAADFASAGHMVAEGKGHAWPDDLVDDLLAYLQVAATASRHCATNGHCGGRYRKRLRLAC